MVAPIVQFARQRVNNRYLACSERFSVKAKSAVSHMHADDGKAILDTGASHHVLKTRSHMGKVYRDTSYSVIGVNGENETTNVEYVGGINMRVQAWSWDDDKECTVTLTDSKSKATVRCPDPTAQSSPALYCPQSPVSLVAWSLLWRAGWRVNEDFDQLFHREHRVTIYLGYKNGLPSLPLEKARCKTEKNETSTFLSSSMTMH